MPYRFILPCSLKIRDSVENVASGASFWEQILAGSQRDVPPERLYEIRLFYHLKRYQPWVLLATIDATDRHIRLTHFRLTGVRDVPGHNPPRLQHL